MARFSKVPAPEAKAAFVAALRRGAPVKAAARAAGVALASLYLWRRSDARFDVAWTEAAEASAGRLYAAGPGERGRPVRAKRRLRFAGARRQAFLDRLSEDCSTDAAARDCGFHPATIHRAIRRDPGFARAYADALERGYERLERLAAEERAAARARRRVEPAPGARPPSGFDAQMRLLRAWRRRDGSLGPRRVGRRSLRSQSFEAAMEALARRLRNLGIVTPSS